MDDKELNKIIYLHEFPKNTRIVHADKQVQKRDKNGIPKIFLQVECPLCSELKWVSKINLNHRPTQSTFCNKHKRLSQVKWVTPDETFLKNKDVIVDISKQRLLPIGVTVSKGRNAKSRNVEIWVTCPDCHEGRWTLVNGIRNAKFTTLCPSCAAKRIPRRGKNAYNWTGGIQVNALGYVTIHREVIKERYGEKALETVQFYLKSHKNYYAEHRVVALLSFGPLAVSPGTVVRHINGDKKDNRPENLIYGSQHQNIQDHVQDRNELKIWKGIALNLFRLLVAIQHQSA